MDFDKLIETVSEILENEKIEKKVVNNTPSKVVQSKSSDDEWESF